MRADGNNEAKMREIIYARRSKDCRQIGTRVSLENIQQVLKMVTVIGQFTADSRVLVEAKFNAHLPISADDRVGVWYTAVQYTLDELAPTTEAELIRILRNSSDKTCCLDAIPTNLIKKYASLHIPYLVAIVNNSFKEGLFPSALRTAVVRP